MGTRNLIKYSFQLVLLVTWPGSRVACIGLRVLIDTNLPLNNNDVLHGGAALNAQRPGCDSPAPRSREIELVRQLNSDAVRLILPKNEVTPIFIKEEFNS
jgi:hypothetical protein